MKREPSDDGTLEVKVEDATKIGRVLISDDKHRGGLYYPDEDEPQSVSFENDTEIKSCSKDSDLISRADAIRVVEKNSYRMAGLTEVKLKCEIEALPSADNLNLIDRVDAFNAIVEVSRGLVKYGCINLGNASEYLKAMRELPPAERRRSGKWCEMGENKDGTHNIRCDQCGESFKARGHANSHNTKKKYRFCPSCGADMRGDTK